MAGDYKPTDCLKAKVEQERLLIAGVKDEAALLRKQADEMEATLPAWELIVERLEQAVEVLQGVREPPSDPNIY